MVGDLYQLPQGNRYDHALKEEVLTEPYSPTWRHAGLPTQTLNSQAIKEEAISGMSTVIESYIPARGNGRLLTKTH
jgi:hypothetical protein